MLGKIFGPERDKVSGDLRRSHNDELIIICNPQQIFGPERDKVTGDLRRSHNDELIIICNPQQILSVLPSQ